MYKNVSFTGEIFEEDGTYVAYCPELDLSSCGHDLIEARKNLLESTRLFMEEALKMGTLKDILEEAGYDISSSELKSPLVETERLELKIDVGVCFSSRGGRSFSLYQGRGKTPCGHSQISRTAGFYNKEQLKNSWN